MSVLVVLHSLDERALIDGCIRIQMLACRNVADGLKKPSQADYASVGLAGRTVFATIGSFCPSSCFAYPS